MYINNLDILPRNYKFFTDPNHLLHQIKIGIEWALVMLPSPAASITQPTYKTPERLRYAILRTAKYRENLIPLESQAKGHVILSIREALQNAHAAHWQSLKLTHPAIAERVPPSKPAKSMAIKHAIGQVGLIQAAPGTQRLFGKDQPLYLPDGTLNTNAPAALAHRRVTRGRRSRYNVNRPYDLWYMRHVLHWAEVIVRWSPEDRRGDVQGLGHHTEGMLHPTLYKLWPIEDYRLVRLANVPDTEPDIEQSSFSKVQTERERKRLERQRQLRAMMGLDMTEDEIQRKVLEHTLDALTLQPAYESLLNQPDEDQVTASNLPVVEESNGPDPLSERGSASALFIEPDPFAHAIMPPAMPPSLPQPEYQHDDEHDELYRQAGVAPPTAPTAPSEPPQPLHEDDPALTLAKLEAAGLMEPEPNDPNNDPTPNNDTDTVVRVPIDVKPMVVILNPNQLVRVERHTPVAVPDLSELFADSEGDGLPL